MKRKVKPTIENILKYAVNNIDFYKSSRYTSKIKNNRTNKNFDILSKLPIIDGEKFKEEFYRFITGNRENEYLVFTSGSTGKPKIIPVTRDDLNLIANAFLDAYKNVFGAAPELAINKLPPPPAISGLIMEQVSINGSMFEIDPGPGQTVLDSLRYADEVIRSTKPKNKKIILSVYPSAFFREFYSYEDKAKAEFAELSSRNELYLLLGGEALDLGRAKLLYSLVKPKGILDVLASTERLFGYKFYDEEELKSEKYFDNNPFKISMYNNYFALLKYGKLYSLEDKKNEGLEGELIMTSKGITGGAHMPFINYNTKEKVKFVDFDKNYLYLEFLGRTNRVFRFGVAKLNDILIDNVIASVINEFHVGEGYCEIIRENGLDKISFHFYHNNRSFDSQKLLSFINDKLSAQQMELKYTLDNKLAYTGVSLEEKDKIPFYDSKIFKSPKIIDKRKIEHY